MAEKITTIEAVSRLERGLVVWDHEVGPVTLGTLNGMVANSEIVKCQHSQFTWFFAWRQLPHESVHDKAFQIVRATRPAVNQKVSS